jgi:VCBS repeat-containing protein
VAADLDADTPPSAAGDSVTVTEDDGAATIDVLANDTDADGGPKAIESVDTTGSNGQVRIVGSDPPDRPNIVFVLTDDQAYDSLSRMPFISRFNGWTRFENAFISDPVCCPSRASILTGQYPHHTGVENNSDRGLFDDSSTLATWLDDAGYRTALFGKYHLHYPSLTYVPPGWDEWAAFPDGAYYNYQLNENGQLVSYGSAPSDYSTDVLAGKAVDFIDQADDRTPFFLYLAVRAPHDGYIPAPRHDGRYSGELVSHPPNLNETDVSDKPAWVRALAPRNVGNMDGAQRKADASLLGVDDAVKSIFDTLSAKGLTNDTVVAFMTDNGYSFGSHRWRGKTCAYEECIRTPLLVSDPGGTPHTIPQLVSNVDIAPTFADLAGVTPGAPVDGHSLVPFLEGSTPTDWQNEVLLRFKHDASQDTPPSFWGIRTPDYKYVELPDTGETELYDLANDPYELQNVADDPAYTDVRTRLAQRLDELRSTPPRTITMDGGSGASPGSSLTYEPDPNYCNDPDPAPEDMFTYTLNGGSTATVSVKVDCAEDPPVAVNDQATVTEDDPATAIDVLSNDTDVEGDPKGIEWVDTTGTKGAVAITNAGTGLTYEPPANYCNDAVSGVGLGPDDYFDYALNGGSTATAYVKVSCVDDAPVAVSDSKTVSEDAPATAINVLANDTDIDGGPKRVESVDTTGTHGAVNITGGGTGLDYAPSANYCNRPGTGPLDTFTYTLNGGSTATVSVKVSCVDDAPVAVEDATTITEDDPATSIDVLGNDTDVDGGPEVVRSKTNGAHGTVAIVNSGRAVTYKPAANYCNDPDPAPDDTFTYTLNGGSTANVSVTVSCVDDLPTAANDTKTVPEDAPATALDVLANDPDVDGGKRIESIDTTGSVGLVDITGGGAGVDYQPPANYCNRPGTGPLDTFTYTLNGGSMATVSVRVSCVDDSPIAVHDATVMTEDDPATAIDVLANDTDIDGGPKLIRSKTNAAHGTVAIINSGTGLSYQPAPNYCNDSDPASEDTFNYTLNGGSTATVSVQVTCVDDPGVAVDDAKTISEDDPATAIDVLANDLDVDGGKRVDSVDTTGTVGQVSIADGGAGVDYQPSHNYCNDPDPAPDDNFTYTLNSGSTATVHVTVSCVDDAPVAVDDAEVLTEDDPATTFHLLANDTDIDGGPKSVASVDTTGTAGSVAIAADGFAVDYTPAANYCNRPGTGPLDTFTYTLNGGSTATVSVTVTCVEDAPVAANDTTTLSEDAPVRAIDVLANDTDVDGGTKRIESIDRTGTVGFVAITGGGRGLQYQPSPNYCNDPDPAPDDTFTYSLNGGSTATVSVTVTCVDDPPVAIDDATTLNENDPPTAIDVLANDTDIDGGPKRVAKLDLTGTLGAVAITNSGADVTYTPALDYCNDPDPAPEDTFKYTLNRGSSATVSVAVTCLPD